jgi:hypothetical protein
MPCKLLLFERSGRPNRTQEVAGSSPASSIREVPGKFWPKVVPQTPTVIWGTVVFAAQA